MTLFTLVYLLLVPTAKFIYNSNFEPFSFRAFGQISPLYRFMKANEYVALILGDLYLTVVVTTVVNFSVMGLVLLARSFIRTKKRNQRSLNFYQNK